MRLLTLREVADALQVSEKTVRRLVGRGDLVGFKVGDRGQVRVKEEDLEAYLEAQRIQADGQASTSDREVGE